MPPAVVFGAHIQTLMPALVVAHNHPSGDPEPSSEDHAVTRKLMEGAELLDVEFLDHIVWGADGWVSMRTRGWN
jgi:DNA repair protein RadC